MPAEPSEAALAAMGAKTIGVKAAAAAQVPAKVNCTRAPHSRPRRPQPPPPPCAFIVVSSAVSLVRGSTIAAGAMLVRASQR